MNVFDLLLVAIVSITTTLLTLVVVFAASRSKSSINSTRVASLKSAIARLKKVKELTERQAELLAAAEAPQKNALDGLYKNDLVKEAKEIEKEKNNILRSVLQDGFDPPISLLMADGTKTTSKLSEYLSTIPVEEESKIKKSSLKIYKAETKEGEE
jgi:Na+-translocating ferredoxin:NAD+ oxidoreductase RnfG subunit